LIQRIPQAVQIHHPSLFWPPLGVLPNFFLNGAKEWCRCVEAALLAEIRTANSLTFSFLFLFRHFFPFTDAFLLCCKGFFTASIDGTF
jgi:hypothetical protein